MTPDKDGWLYWTPGQEKPRNEDICDVQILFPGLEWEYGNACEKTDTWDRYPRRYRLRTPAISPQDVRVGDMVTLKPGPYEVINTQGLTFGIKAPESAETDAWIDHTMIATATRPKPDPIGELEGVIADLESSQWPRAKVCADTLRRVAGMLNKEREG